MNHPAFCVPVTLPASPLVPSGASTTRLDPSLIRHSAGFASECCGDNLPPSSSAPTTAPISMGASSRRDFLRLASAFSFLPFMPGIAGAVNGLRVLPLRAPLSNTYFLMRAAETPADVLGTAVTNPIERMSLSLQSLTKQGVSHTMRASSALESFALKSDSIGDDVWIWPSIATASYETAEVMAATLRVPRSHIVPEFSFLDARGLGSLQSPADAHLGDAQNGTQWRPPPADDGTPNDSVDDVFVRVRQLISKLETQYDTQEIVLIAPDSDALTVWQAAITGGDIARHADLAYAPGEMRLVKEQVVDGYGEEIEKGFAKTIFKP